MPLVIIYVTYYGARAAAYIVAMFYAAMVLSGIADLLFSAFRLMPSGPRPPSAIEHAEIVWNYTSWLDLIALVGFAASLVIHFRQSRPAHAHCH